MVNPGAGALAVALLASAPAFATPPDAPAAPAAPAASKPSSDDIDLGSMGLDPSAAPFDDKLNIFGFADINYLGEHLSKPIAVSAQDSRAFQVGNLNLYLAKNLTRQARTLIEVRFTFLPNGSLNADGTYVDTSAQDLANFSRPTRWGGVVIERAYAEYDLGQHFTIRAGHWLTPYGIWNIDHGSPAIIGTSRPYIIGEEFFPEHQTGLDLFGSYDVDRFKVDYHVTASNGRGPTEAVADADTSMAFGGRLAVETPWGLKVGASIYHGRYTGLPATAGATAETYREDAYGADAQYDVGALHLQGEVMAHVRHETTDDTALAAAGVVTGAATAPNGRAYGGYLLAGYRFSQLWNVMPYAQIQDYHPYDLTLFSKINGGALGLNFRPTPSLVFKLQGEAGTFGDGPGYLSDVFALLYTAQISWVF